MKELPNEREGLATAPIPRADNLIDAALNGMGGEPLIGSGFEQEAPDPDFDERS